MTSHPRRHSSILPFVRAEHGYSAAEKALAAVLALGLLLMVVRILLWGAGNAADNAKLTLEGESGEVQWTDGSGGGTPSGGASGQQAGVAQAMGSSGDSGSHHSGGGGLFGWVAGAAHVVLGTATMVPGLGTPAALLDAGIYELQGDPVNAEISLDASIPFAGTLIEAPRMADTITRSINSDDTDPRWTPEDEGQVNAYINKALNDNGGDAAKAFMELRDQRQQPKNYYDANMAIAADYLRARWGAERYGPGVELEQIDAYMSLKRTVGVPKEGPGPTSPPSDLEDQYMRKGVYDEANHRSFLQRLEDVATFPIGAAKALYDNLRSLLG